MRSPWATPVVTDVFIFIRRTGYNRGLDEYWVTPLFYFRVYFDCVACRLLAGFGSSPFSLAECLLEAILRLGCSTVCQGWFVGFLRVIFAQRRKHFHRG